MASEDNSAFGTEEILIHLMAIARNELTITDAQILEVAQTDPNRAEVLTGLLILNETLVDQRQQILEARDAAEENARLASAASEAKSRFLANMSHELRTPMNGVVAVASLLATTETNEEQREYIDILTDSSGTLLALINQLLDFAKIEEGKLELDIIDFDLHLTIATLVARYAPLAAANGVMLAGEVQPGVPRWVSGDSNRLVQILSNLIGNAIKFTAEGKVLLKLGIAETQDNPTRISFAVRDTGIGIRSEDQARIFETFSQADDSTTRRFGGTGLGLAISRQLVELMQGNLTVNSTPGLGSTFVAEIPFMNADADSLLGETVPK